MRLKCTKDLFMEVNHILVFSKGTRYKVIKNKTGSIEKMVVLDNSSADHIIGKAWAPYFIRYDIKNLLKSL